MAQSWDTGLEGRRAALLHTLTLQETRGRWDIPLRRLHVDIPFILDPSVISGWQAQGPQNHAEHQ